ncbi:MAG: STAS domain-containing protein [Planctomycetota bacterium]
MFEVVASTEGTITRLGLHGRLDATSSPGLDSKLDALLTAGVRHIVVECAQLEYISSAGLRVFLTFAKTLRKRKGQMAFCAMQPIVYQVFEICEFTDILPICQTMEEATAKVREGDHPSRHGRHS